MRADRPAGSAVHSVPAWALSSAALVAVGAVAGFALGAPGHGPGTGSSTSSTPPGHLTLVPPTTATSAPPATPATQPPPATTTPVLSDSGTQAGAAPTACAQGDIAVSVTTGAASYGAGQDVVIPATLQFLRTCNFSPTDVPGGDCPTTIAVLEVDQGGRQVWPNHVETPVCQRFAAGVAPAGSRYTITFNWDQGTDAGTDTCCTVFGHSFQAETTWAWVGPSAVTTASAASAVFHVS